MKNFDEEKWEKVKEYCDNCGCKSFEDLKKDKEKYDIAMKMMEECFPNGIYAWFSES